MPNRREFLGVGATAAVGAMLPAKLERATDALSGASAKAAAIPKSPKLAMFVDTIPAAPVPTYTPTIVGGVEVYSTTASEAM